MICNLNILVILIIIISLVQYANSDEIKCDSEISVDITDGLMNEERIVKDGLSYDPGNYYRVDDRVFGCPCNFRNCLRKCCPTGQGLYNKTCETSSYDETSNFREHISEGVQIDNFYIIHGIVSCNDKVRFILDPSEEGQDKFMVQENGYLKWQTLEFSPTDYCMEYLMEDNKFAGVLCSDTDVIYHHTIGMIISMPFLLATFLVYAFLPDRNLPAKALMCYVLSLLFAYILLVTIQLDESHGNTTCKALAFFCYFFFMASFFWMNASCLDIFFTFSGIRGLLGERKRENRRFMYYSAYAWGMPVLMVAFAALFGQNQSTESVFYTGLGDGQCWFRNGWPTGIYFYFPIAILLIINIVLFGITTYKIKKVQHDTKMLKNVDSRKHKYDNNDKQRFNLYVKLLFAMGINWSMEVISWVILWKWTTVPDSVWILTDFCNAVYGVFIFFIFVFKRNIWMLLKKRYLQVTGRPQQAHTLTSTHRTTVSQVSSSEA